MYTSNVDRLDELYNRLRELHFSEDTVAAVIKTIQIDPINAYGGAITKDGYIQVWKKYGAYDAIISISDDLGIIWTHSPTRD